MKSENLPWATHVLVTITLLIMLTAVVVGLLAAGIESGEGFGIILNITGGIGGSLATFMIPAAIYMKVAKKTYWLYKLAAAVFSVGFIFMIVVLVETCLSFA